MSHEAFIRFAPLMVLERVNDPRWQGGRTMYYPGGLTFVPGKDSAKLLINHDDERQIGTVHTLMRWEDATGPWLAAVAEVTDPPCWLRRYETRVSFAYKPAGTHEAFGCEISRRGLVTEVSVLSPDCKPAEPLAQVLSFRPTEPNRASSPAAVLSSDRAAVGEIDDDYRPPYWDELERKVGYRITWDNFEQALALANRSPLDEAYDEMLAARQPKPHVLIRPGIGQVLAVGGVPVGELAA